MPDTDATPNPYTDDAYAAFSDQVETTPQPLPAKPVFDAYAAFSDVAEL